MPKEYYHDIDLNRNQLYNSRLQNVTTAARILLGNTLNIFHKGFQVYDTDLLVPYYWDGTAWQTAVNGAIWGNITGVITNQTDLITYLSGNYYPLSSNPAGYITSAPLSGYVPTSRILTINGVSYDLTLDRSWSINSLPSQTGNAGNWLTTDGTNASWAPLPPSGVSAVTASTPLFSSGGATPNITIQQATSLLDGYLSAADWLTFNSKQDVISLTTIGTSGAATFIANTLNIPQYTDQFTGTVTSVDLSMPSAFSVANNPITTSGTLTVTGAGTSSQYIDGTGALQTFSGATGSILHGTAAGTDTYTTTITGVAAYNDADAYLIRFTNGNTTGCTLNINALGAKTLHRNNDGPLLGGDIADGAEMLCVYNSTANNFQVIGISPNSLLAYVTNDDSVPLTKGMPVYAFSGTGDRMTVKRAFNTSDATSAQTVGLVLSTSIGVNQKGFIMMQGLLDGLSILPTATWSDGDPVYLGVTAGTITKVKPYAPNHLVYLGVVTTASNGSAGRMYVRVQNGYELDELHNVQAQSPTLKDTLWYDNAVSPGQWKTASIPTILGYTPPNTYYQNTAPIGTIVLGSFWMNSDTGLLYQYIDDGTSTQWVQESLPLGPVGPTGPAGPNNITSSTVTNLVGILKGDGLTVSVATAGVDYQTVTNLSIDGTFAANSDTLYPSQKATKTYVDTLTNGITDDMDYTLVQSFKSFYNY